MRGGGFWEKHVKTAFHAGALEHPVKLGNGCWTRYVNLDNAATTTPFQPVNEAIFAELMEYGSVHRGSGDKSKVSTRRYEEARETIRRFVNAKPTDYVIFTPNTTVGMNQLAYFFAHIKGRVLVSDIEHSSSWLPWIFQEGRYAVTEKVTLKQALCGETERVNIAIMDAGRERVLMYKTKKDFSFDLNDVEGLFRENMLKDEDKRIKVLVVTGASNVTGYKPPIKDLAEIAHKYDAMMVVDACQLLQHEKIDMTGASIDYAVFSGHKMYAPFGGGAIVGDRRILDAFWPYQMGGGNFPYIATDGEVLRYKTNQAHDPGTPNFVGARAIHHAIRQLESLDMGKIAGYEHELAGYAFRGLKGMEGVMLYVDENPDGSFDRSLITFNIRSMPAKLVAEVLNHEYGIGVRAGSYCVYEFSRRIHGITPQKDRKIAERVRQGVTADIPGSVRASFSLVNNVEDADRLIKAVKEISEKSLDSYRESYIMDVVSGDWKPKTES